MEPQLQDIVTKKYFEKLDENQKEDIKQLNNWSHKLQKNLIEFELIMENMNSIINHQNQATSHTLIKNLENILYMAQNSNRIIGKKKKKPKSKHQKENIFEKIFENHKDDNLPTDKEIEQQLQEEINLAQTKNKTQNKTNSKRKQKNKNQENQQLQQSDLDDKPSAKKKGRPFKNNKKIKTNNIEENTKFQDLYNNNNQTPNKNQSQQLVTDFMENENNQNIFDIDNNDIIQYPNEKQQDYQNNNNNNNNINNNNEQNTKVIEKQNRNNSFSQGFYCSTNENNDFNQNIQNNNVQLDDSLSQKSLIDMQNQMYGENNNFNIDENSNNRSNNISSIMGNKNSIKKSQISHQSQKDLEEELDEMFENSEYLNKQHNNDKNTQESIEINQNFNQFNENKIFGLNQQ